MKYLLKIKYLLMILNMIFLSGILVADDYRVTTLNDHDCNPTILEKIISKAKVHHTSSLIISKNGEIILEMQKKNNKEKLIETMSVTKSFLNLAIGFLIDDGYLDSIDLPVYHIYPEWYQGNKKKITIRHLMNHTSGLQSDNAIDEITRADNIIQLALAAELTSQPGTEFYYNNKATNLLSDIVYKLSGKPVDAYLAEKLFKPLEITSYMWERDLTGNLYGMSGLKLDHKALLKVGQMLLDNGKWKGQQIVNSSWLDESLKPSQTFNPYSGLLWWLKLDRNGKVAGFAAQGYMGQYIVVIPKSKIVGVRQLDLNDFPNENDLKKFDFEDFCDLLYYLDSEQ